MSTNTTTYKELIFDLSHGKNITLHIRQTNHSIYANKIEGNYIKYFCWKPTGGQLRNIVQDIENFANYIFVI